MSATGTVVRHRVSADVELEISEHRGPRPGATLTVLGGVHGDEFEGQLAAAISASELGPRLEAGTLRVVAAANPLAVRSQTRETVEDGRNLARSFPGDPEGSITQRVAWELTERAIKGSDVLIDLHSAGRALSMPLLVGYAGSQAESCRPLAEVFGAAFVWEHDEIGPGRSISAAAASGVVALYAECAGGGSVRDAELSVLVAGVERLAQRLGLIGDAPPAPASGSRFLRGGDGDLDASLNARSRGLAVLRVDVGAQVRSGDVIIEIRDRTGRVVDEVKAHADATVMALRRHAVVEEGDLLAMLGPSSS